MPNAFSEHKKFFWTCGEKRADPFPPFIYSCHEQGSSNLNILVKAKGVIDTLAVYQSELHSTASNKNP